MKFIKFFLVGIVFGIVLSKAEVISWYRIIEMFRFESFHMYGVIGTAVLTGILGIQILKKWQVKSIEGKNIEIMPKEKGWLRYLLGGSVFGLGWAMTGACPGPMFILVGKGMMSFVLVVFSAMFGTFLYGVLQKKLPH